MLLVLRQLHIDSYKITSCKSLLCSWNKLSRLVSASNTASLYFQALWVPNYIIQVYRLDL